MAGPTTRASPDFASPYSTTRSPTHCPAQWPPEASSWWIPLDRMLHLRICEYQNHAILEPKQRVKVHILWKKTNRPLDGNIPRMRHECIGGVWLQRIPNFYAHLQDPTAVCSESGTTDVYRRLPLLPKQVGDPCHLGTIPASNGANKQRRRLGARDKPKRQGAKEQTPHAHKPASLDCSFALSLLVPSPVSHTSVYLCMYLHIETSIYIYMYFSNIYIYI